MHLEFSTNARNDFQYWTKKDPQKLKKIFYVLEAILENPFFGIGKPERLKHDYAGCWSRRIDREHRLVYRMEAQSIVVLSLRYHYL